MDFTTSTLILRIFLILESIFHVLLVPSNLAGVEPPDCEGDYTFVIFLRFLAAAPGGTQAA